MKLVIPTLVHQKIMHWVNKSEYEVSGLGKIQTEPGGTMTVLDVMMLPQKNAAAHTDIEAEDVGRAMYLLKDTPGDLRFWWHSHVNMSVFWSGQDKETIKLCGQGGWCVATVFNKKNESRTAFYSVHGMLLPWGREELFYDDIRTVVSPVSPETVKMWDEEYDRNVKIQRWTVGEQTAHSGQSESGTTTGSNATVLTGGTTKLTKKQRKQVKKMQKELAEKIEGQTAIEFNRGLTVPDEPYDLFDEHDRMVMRAMDFTEDQIEWLNCIEYFSTYEILEMVQAGWSPTEIIWAADYAEGKNLDADDIMATFTPQSRVGLESGEREDAGSAAV